MQCAVCQFVSGRLGKEVECYVERHNAKITHSVVWEELTINSADIQLGIGRPIWQTVALNGSWECCRKHENVIVSHLRARPMVGHGSINNIRTQPIQ